MSRKSFALSNKRSKPTNEEIVISVRNWPFYLSFPLEQVIQVAVALEWGGTPLGDDDHHPD
jgi:hypothetical protein